MGKIKSVDIGLFLKLNYDEYGAVSCYKYQKSPQLFCWNTEFLTILAKNFFINYVFIVNFFFQLKFPRI